MQEEVEQKSLTLTVNAAKMTARLFRAAIAKYVAHKKEKKHDAQTGVRYVGRQSVKKLVGQNQGVSNIELSGQDLKEFQRIKEESHTAMIFISHDLGAVSKIADEIVVMNGGKLVEQGDFEHILRHAKDPYTRMLAETRRSVMERYRLCLDNQEELCLN